MKFVHMVLLSLVVLGTPGRSRAQSSDAQSGLSTLAVQNRQHTRMHEFGFMFGTLPLDAFTKGLTFSGAYTLHFNDFIAWEVGEFTYSHPIDTHLKEDLANLQQAVGVTAFEIVRYFITSSVVIKPIYGKFAVLNRTLLFGELFLALGGGYGEMTNTGRTVVDAGGGIRVYAGPIVSFRLDVRDYMFLTRDDLHNELWVALGVSLSFG